MHYCCYLYTTEFPTNDVIQKALDPFYEYRVGGENDPEPPFHFDWFMIGGRYGGKLKLDISNDRAIEKYMIEFLCREKRAGRLFRSALMEDSAALDLEAEYVPRRYGETELLKYCGQRDGILYVDGAWLPDIANMADQADKCFCIIDTDGTAMARRTRSNGKWMEDPDFDEKARALCKRDGNERYLTVLDLHT